MEGGEAKQALAKSARRIHLGPRMDTRAPEGGVGTRHSRAPVGADLQQAVLPHGTAGDSRDRSE
jgi:hypothetical protein